MGIPKFFRWISERYPLCSQLIQENRIPEFDNLYLDMNGLIHPCSHPNDGDAHFRITEQEIYQNIFDYIDSLFQTIKPKKLLFMAVDGVAPRAKMNQQRSRRFQTAREAEESRRKALAKGQTLPDSDPFDSNAITPGTTFMTKLSEQLKWYANLRVSEDPAWKNVEVILSGHDVPGEGEHKIMEYLRLAKSSPDYDHNIRHCIYGLDADLIMLGLLTHEPHFALLREKVNFGRKQTKTSTKAENQEFYLLHLSLIREYLDLEFGQLKDAISFPYDLERIIDDFILMCYFVGNDFLPNLPNLHIREGALAQLFDVYKSVLQRGDGYLHESGVLNMRQLQAFLGELGAFERRFFENERTDLKWLAGKMMDQKHNDARKLAQSSAAQTLTPTQKAILENVKEFVHRHSRTERLAFQPSLPARDRAFIGRLAKDLGLTHAFEVGPHDSKQMMIDWDSDDDESDDESNLARLRVLQKYDRAAVKEEDELADAMEREMKMRMDEEFVEWKRTYYKEKMNFDYGSEEMKQLAYHYIEGVQWVLHYYYSGVVSWGWFYPYYYTPMITDINDIEHYTFKFEKGEPFKPFEQLMGVLPAASRMLVPECYRDLMTDAHSPIHDFYPLEFETDLNGKKQGWEAIVKIPFVDEKRLWSAMRPREKQLTPSERARNRFGNTWHFAHREGNEITYPSSLPGVFKDIVNCHTEMTVFHLPILGEKGFVRGLLSGTRLGVRAQAGFPSLDTIQHTGALGLHSVRVFEMDSRNESMIITLQNPYENVAPEEVALKRIGNRIFVGWPFLTEAIVASVADETSLYSVIENGGQKRVVKIPQTPEQCGRFQNEANRIEGEYSKRFAVITGPVELILYARLLQGMRHLDDGSVVKFYSEPQRQSAFALQATVEKVEYEDIRYMEQPPLPVSVDFPLGSKVFFLGLSSYGSLAEVKGHTAEGDLLVIRLQRPDKDVDLTLTFGTELVKECMDSLDYKPNWQVASELGLKPITVSRITASLLVSIVGSGERVNIGLNMKFDAKQKKVLGYTRKTDQSWEYSKKAVDLIQAYKVQFPEVFAVIDRKQKDTFEASDFYSRDPTLIQNVSTWLKSVASKFELADLDCESLTSDYITRVEEATDGTSAASSTPKFVIVKGVPRQALLKPSSARVRLVNQSFALGDRVVYADGSGEVPTGLKGTVVGLRGKLSDVIFDTHFQTNGSSSIRRKEVPSACLINLTNRQPPVSSDTLATVMPINVNPHRGRQISNGVPRPVSSPSGRGGAVSSRGWGRPETSGRTPYAASEFKPDRSIGGGDDTSDFAPRVVTASAPPVGQFHNGHHNNSTLRGMQSARRGRGRGYF